ncbi:MAG: AcrB/AcrD/AcrF family protein [Bryobacteraceae bacterium]
MTLPTTYLAALLLTILTMFCWGSWANTFKLAGKWRFELFYFDYALGVLVAAVIAAYTFGTFGFDGFLFMDDLMRAGKRNMALGFAGGVVFNLANMLLVAAISVAGMAVAFPVGVGLALVIGVIWSYLLNPQGNPTLLFTGAALVVLAIILDAAAYRALSFQREEAKIKAGLSRTLKPKVSMKGILISLVSGLLMGSFYPLVEMGKAGDAGLGPYAIAFVFATGVFASTFIFNMYFMNLPVQGEPIEVLEYFRGKPKQHLLGIFGGVIWCVGAVANFVAASTPPEVQVGPAVSYAIGQGATMVSALWGLFVWKEFEGADAKVKALLVLMFFLFLAGLITVSIAPLYVTK